MYATKPAHSFSARLKASPQQAAERLDLLDIYLENNLEQFTESSKEFFNELQSQVHLKFNLDANTIQNFKESPKELPDYLHNLGRAKPAQSCAVPLDHDH